MKIKIYVEGGGDTRDLRSSCREGFSEFFRKAGLEGKMPSILACGGRQQAYKSFCTALEDTDQTDFIVLLVDSEGPVKQDTSWEYLRMQNKNKQKSWEQPVNAEDDNAHLMVQVMETWFLADKETLAGYFGQGFKEKALPPNPDIENISKPDVLNRLKSATRECTPKGEYGKGRDSFKILANIDPNKVTAASPHAKRLVNTLKTKAGI